MHVLFTHHPSSSVRGISISVVPLLSLIICLTVHLRGCPDQAVRPLPQEQGQGGAQQNSLRRVQPGGGGGGGVRAQPAGGGGNGGDGDVEPTSVDSFDRPPDSEHNMMEDLFRRQATLLAKDRVDPQVPPWLWRCNELVTLTCFVSAAALSTPPPPPPPIEFVHHRHGVICMQLCLSPTHRNTCHPKLAGCSYLHHIPTAPPPLAGAEAAGRE